MAVLVGACQAGLVPDDVHAAVSSQNIIRHDQPAPGIAQLAGPLIQHPLLQQHSTILQHSAPIVQETPIAQHIAPGIHAPVALARDEHIEESVSTYILYPTLLTF